MSADMSLCCGLSVRGMLARIARGRRDAKAAVRGMNDSRTGRQATVEVVTDWLMEHLSQGHEVVPMGPCDRWDWKKGCQGHPADDNAGQKSAERESR